MKCHDCSLLNQLQILLESAKRRSNTAFSLCFELGSIRPSREQLLYCTTTSWHHLIGRMRCSTDGAIMAKYTYAPSFTRTKRIDRIESNRIIARNARSNKKWKKPKKSKKGQLCILLKNQKSHLIAVKALLVSKVPFSTEKCHFRPNCPNFEKCQNGQKESKLCQ